MPLEPRRNNSDDLQALEPIDLLPVKGPQSVYPYLAQQQNPILHYWQILRKRKWAVLAAFAHCSCALRNYNPECDPPVPSHIEGSDLSRKSECFGIQGRRE